MAKIWVGFFCCQHGRNGIEVNIRHQDFFNTDLSSASDHLIAVMVKFTGINVGMGINHRIISTFGFVASIRECEHEVIFGFFLLCR
ncbi:Uncharacterised protein [Vibrio cholerae]|nr:Uncharacterised protein [Vibrio cholerae]CSC04034.1 Uncharacterised protein [Vibrio cholerae]CSC51238.1 Uncharacterised protein [Vibrio cholerae]CSC75857.1 Uncharacterised protein [Vibrio cholerae]CSD04589.1 Uncharacterised protein [Vibrio cholerae]